MIVVHALSAKTGEKMYYFFEVNGDKIERLKLPEDQMGKFLLPDETKNNLVDIPNDE
jgi:hypothetical protein